VASSKFLFWATARQFSKNIGPLRRAIEEGALIALFLPPPVAALSGLFRKRRSVLSCDCWTTIIRWSRPRYPKRILITRGS
jgi:hypothetical protein